MLNKRTCKNPDCRCQFTPRTQTPNQQYCSSKLCQRARKAAWQKQKLKTDEDYRANQRHAQEAWRQKNPGYWQKWRQCHPEYVENNRKKQLERNNKRALKYLRQPESASGWIAKMDVCKEQNHLSSGTYEVVAVTDEPVCKDGRVTIDNLFIIKEVGHLIG